MTIDYNSQINKLGKTVEYIEKSALPAVGRALWNYDKEQILSHINGLTGVNYILNISVFDEFDTAFVSTSKEYKTDNYTEQRRFELTITRDGNTRNLGYLTILITKKYIYADLIKRFAIFFLSQGLKTFLISFFILFIFYKLVGESIASIAMKLKNMESGDLTLIDTKHWEKNPDNEIGVLGRSINSLIIQVKKSQEINIEKLQKSESDLTSAQKLSKLGSWKYYLDGTEVIWSEQMFHIFDLDPSGKEETLQSHIDSVHYDDVNLWHQMYKQILMDGERIEFSYRIFTASKRMKWLDVIANAEFSDSGEIISLWGTCQDITEKVHIKKELEQKQKLLNHSAKLASIGELAAGVGHEINNPLTIIRGATVSMQRRLLGKGELKTEDLDKYFNKMVSVSDRMSAIVNVLRTFSRKDDDNFTDFKVAEVLNESINLISDLLKQSGAEVHNNIDPAHSNLVVNGNRGRLQQVFMNLLSNAKDACEDSDQKIVSISTRLDGNNIELLFKDTGCGMDTSISQKIFDPFFTTKSVGSGTGIGLSLVHNIVEEHSGSIRVESTQNIGSTFFLCLPLAEQVIIEDIKNSDLPFHEKKLDLNVLVLDDEEDVREVLVCILQEMGMKVTEFGDGAQALEHLSSNKDYDFILSDMVMPGLSGLEFLKEAKDLTQGMNTKYLLMSGGVNIDFENPENEVSRLIDGYFFKPFQEEEVFQIFEDLSSK